MGTHLIIRKEEAGQQVRGLSWKEKRPRSSTPMRCSCSYGRGIPRIIMKVWESYLENKTPAAGRMFWVYGPNQADITMLGLDPHPNDKAGAYRKITLSQMGQEVK